MTNHFAFTKLVVSDLDACAAFYTRVFGLEEQYRVRSEIASRPIDEIMYQATAPGGGTFVLLRYADDPLRTRTQRDEVVLGFVTDHIDALFTRAVEAGGTVAQPVTDAPEHGVKVGFLTDVEGNLIEVVQPL